MINLKLHSNYSHSCKQALFGKHCIKCNLKIVETQDVTPTLGEHDSSHCLCYNNDALASSSEQSLEQI